MRAIRLVQSRAGVLLPAAGEALLVLCVYGAYSVVRVVVEGRPGNAVDNAFDIIAMEKALGIFLETRIQRAFAEVPGLLLAMEGVYRFLYLPIIIIGASAGYLRDRQLYTKYRLAFFMSLAMGLVFFKLLPVAPPRMLPEFGFVDVMQGGAMSSSDGARNNFAAMPSFHFGLPLLVTIGFCHAYRLEPWKCAFAGLVPALMLLSIVSTANHFFLDAVIGAVVVLFAAWWCVWRTGSVGIPAQTPAQERV